MCDCENCDRNANVITKHKANGKKLKLCEHHLYVYPVCCMICDRSINLDQRGGPEFVLLNANKILLCSKSCWKFVEN